MHDGLSLIVLSEMNCFILNNLPRTLYNIAYKEFGTNYIGHKILSLLDLQIEAIAELKLFILIQFFQVNYDGR